jgi:hypothetical protein
MATAEELIDQAKAASTTQELDAIEAQADDRKTVTEAVAARRQALEQGPEQQPPANKTAQPAQSQQTTRTLVRERTVIETAEPPPGPNATTEPPSGQYFLNTAGDEVNAWGEKKGSPEDRARRAGGGIA